MKKMNRIGRVVLILSAVFLLPLCSSSKTADDYFAQARQFISQNRHNEALQALESAIQTDQGNYLNRFKRAIIFINMGRNRNALDDLNEILNIQPEFDQATNQRAQLYLRDCQIENALSDIETLKRHNYDPAEVSKLNEEALNAERLLSRSKKLQSTQSKDQSELIQILSELVSVCSQDGDLRMSRAEAFENSGDVVSAVGEYTKASILKPNNIPAFLKLAELRLKLGEVDLANAAVKGCLHLDPEHSKCKKLFRTLKNVSKSLEKAENAISKGKLKDALGSDALDVDGDSSSKGLIPLIKELKIDGEIKAKAWKLTCECYARLKMKDQAKRYCEEAIQMDDNDFDTHCHLGDILILLEDFEGAVREYTKAKDITSGQNRKVLEGLQKAQKLLKQSKKKDYYKILGVSRDATESDIKSAYRKMARNLHPDKVDDKDKEEAEKKMAELNVAYEILSDPEKKARYDSGDDPNDQEGHGGHPFEGGFPFGQGFPFGHGFPGGGGSGQHFQFHFQ